MAVELASAYISLIPSAKGITSSLQRELGGPLTRAGATAGDSASKQFGSRFSKGMKIAAVAAGGLIAVGVGKFFKDAFGEAEDAAKVGRQTAAVLKSTGGIAGVTAKQVDGLASSLSNVAGVDDELIAAGQNVLLTFTGIRNEAGAGNDIFNQATGAALNLSAALGTDLQGSVIQVGKALNDPIKGVTALSRVGVSFTAQQKEQIKTLVESGRTLDAQKLILGELGKEFGGAAAAAATPSAKLGVAIGNLKESFGTLLLPIVERVASFLSQGLIPAVERVVPLLKNFGRLAIFAFQVGFGGKSVRGIHGWLKVFAIVGGLLRGFVDFIKGDVASAGVRLGTLFGLQEDDPRITGMIKALTVIREALVSVVQFVQRNWKPILVAAAAALLVFTSPIVAIVAGLIALYVRFRIVRTVVAALIKTFQAVTEIISQIEWAEIFEEIASKVSAAATVIRNVWQAVAPTVRAALEAIVAVVRPILAIIVGIVFIGVKIITDLWNRFGDTILDKLRIAFNAVIVVVQGALQILQGIFQIITGILTLNWSKAWKGIQNVVAGVFKVILGILKFAVNQISSIIAVGMGLVSAAWGAIWDGIKFIAAGAVEAVVGFVSSLPGRLLGFVKAIGGAALAIGKALLEGIVDGVTGAVGVIADIGKAIANAVGGFINEHIFGNIRSGIRTLANTLADINIPGAGRAFDAASSALNAAARLIPNIPRLGHGGVATSATLAIIGENARTSPEIVSPVKLMAKTFRDELRNAAIDARVIVNGNVNGVDDLNAWADQRDRKLVAALGAGTR